MFQNLLNEIKLDEEEQDIKIEEALNAIRNKPETRDPKDVYTLYKYLQMTSLARKLKSERLTNSSVQNLMIYVALNIDYIEYEKDEIIFHEGEIGDRFYIILKGEVNILKSSPYYLYLTAGQYFEILTDLQNKEYYDLLIKTIRANNHIFPVTLLDLEKMDIDEIHFRRFILSSVRVELDTTQLKNLFKHFKRNPSDYYINFIEIENALSLAKNYEEAVSLYQKHIRRLFDSDINLNYYSYLEDLRVQYVTIYEYSSILSLAEKEYFGDYALDSNHSNTRKATIQCAKYCHLGVVYNEAYKLHILEEKKKMWELELNFFMDNFFFSPIRRNIFREDYFHYFKYIHLFKKNYLIKEGDPMEWVYFIKDGEVEFSITSNLSDLNKLLNVLSSVLGMKYDMYQVKTYYQFLKEKLNRAHKHKLFRLKLKQEIGLIEYMYKYPSICSVKVISDDASFYRISYKELEDILSKESRCNPLIYKKSKDSLKALVKRIITVRNSLFELVDQNTIIEQNSIKKANNLEKIQNTYIFNNNEPNINFEAHIKPNVYSKIYREKDSPNSSLSSFNKSVDPSTRKSAVEAKKEQSKSIVNNNSSTNDFHSTLNPEAFKRQKIFVSQRDIHKELNLVKDYYKKTNLVGPIAEDQFQEKHRVNEKKERPILPYVFLSQQTLKKSKSTQKLKVKSPSFENKKLAESLPRVNKSVHMEFNENSTLLYEKGDLFQVLKKQSKINNEIKKIKKKGQSLSSIVY